MMDKENKMSGGLIGSPRKHCEEVKLVEIALIVLHALLAIGLIAVILLQSGKSAGLSGSIAGGAETLLGKKKGLDDFLGKITIVVGAVFGILALVLSVIFK